jgi:hypothetical protein
MQPEKIPILMMISADFHGKLNFNKEREEKRRTKENESWAILKLQSFYSDFTIVKMVLIVRFESSSHESVIKSEEMNDYRAAYQTDNIHFAVCSLSIKEIVGKKIVLKLSRERVCWEVYCLPSNNSWGLSLETFRNLSLDLMLSIFSFWFYDRSLVLCPTHKPLLKTHPLED